MKRKRSLVCVKNNENNSKNIHNSRIMKKNNNKTFIKIDPLHFKKKNHSLDMAHKKKIENSKNRINKGTKQ